MPNPIYLGALSIALAISGIQFIRHARRGIPGRVRSPTPTDSTVRLGHAEVIVRSGIGGCFVTVASILAAIGVQQVANRSALPLLWLYVSGIVLIGGLSLLFISATILAAMRRRRK